MNLIVTKDKSEALKQSARAGEYDAAYSYRSIINHGSARGMTIESIEFTEDALEDMSTKDVIRVFREALPGLAHGMWINR